MIRTLKRYFSGKQGEVEGVHVKNRRLAGIKEGLEQYAEAATFALDGSSSSANHFLIFAIPITPKPIRAPALPVG